MTAIAEQFVGYTCWKANDVDEVIRVDAVSPSDAVFLATHQPAKLLKREVGDDKGGEPYDEKRLLEDVLGYSGEMLLVPIVGASGTGKSHLVRWLRAHILETEQRRVVYIPKYNTNLRRVIELILEGLAGPEIDEIRKSLAEAADALDERTARELLLFHLRLRFEHWEPRAAPPSPDGDYRAHLHQRLPALLTDHVFKERLLRSDGVIARFVSEALRGRSLGDRDEPFQFGIDDLPTNVTGSHEAGKAAQDIYRDLVGSERLRRVAVDMLNEFLGSAMRDTFGIGGGRLFDVMMEVRRLLQRRGQELVLLIEDFAILQGIQSDLLDAIIEAPTRDGRRELCGIRAAIAVTSGYLKHLYETVQTRIAFGGYVYSLDVPAGDHGVSGTDIEQFVGRYLNATRLGDARLQQELAHHRRHGEHERSWVPNACDACPVQELCHDAFGVSPDGYGLYPYNRSALHRAVRAQTVKAGGNFDPRRILSQVLRLTLVQDELDIREGSFPSALFAQRHRNLDFELLSTAIEADIEAADRIDAERRKVLLTFWGGVSERVENLHDGIHAAFKLPPLSGIDTQRTGPADSPASDRHGGRRAMARPRQRTAEDAALAAALAELQRWRTGGHTLSQSLARDLRNLVHASVVRAIDWNSHFWRQSREWTGTSASRFSLACVRIASASGGRATTRADAVTLDVKPGLDEARTLEALLKFSHHGHWQFQRGAELYMHAANTIDRWAQDVLRQFLPDSANGSDWDPVPTVAEALLVGARIVGLEGAGSNRTVDLVNALFAPEPATPPPSRGTAWDTLTQAAVGGRAGQTRARLREDLLRHVAVAQGPGAPQAVDVARLLPTIQQVRASWRLPDPPEAAPDSIRRYVQGLQANFDRGIEQERDRLAKWLEEVRILLGDPYEPTAMVEQVLQVSQQAHNLGILSRPDAHQALTDLARRFTRTRHSIVTDLQVTLADFPSLHPGRGLAVVAEDRAEVMQVILQFARQAANMLDQAVRRGAQELETLAQPSSGHEPTIGILAALGDLEQHLQRIKVTAT